MPTLLVVITDGNNTYPAPMINAFSVPPKIVTNLQNISMMYWMAHDI